MGNTRYVRLFNTGVVPNLYFSAQSSGNWASLNCQASQPPPRPPPLSSQRPSGGSESDFAINPAGTTAYIADIVLGFGELTPTAALAGSLPKPMGIGNPGFGVFSVAVDWSSLNPILYGATTEGTSGNVNGNRIVALVDTGASATVKHAGHCHVKSKPFADWISLAGPAS